MKRIHLIEIEDQSWCPKVIRDGITDILRFNINTGKLYHPIAPRLKNLIEKTKTDQIIDLCSGGGGPWPTLSKTIDPEKKLTIHFTDKYPNTKNLDDIKQKLGDTIVVHPESNDATNLSLKLKGMRTLFTSLHHFKPDAAQNIIGDAVKNNQSIAIFEFTHRSPLAIALMLLALITICLVVPFAKPFRWSRLLFTYIIPLLPLVGTFDGIVSCLRTYSPKELREMVAELNADHYQWDIGEQKGNTPIPITYLIGYPKDTNPNTPPSE